MTSKHIVVTVLLATASLSIAARSSDILTNLHLTPETVHDSSIQAVTSDNLTVPYLPVEARQWAINLSVSDRFQAVQALCRVVRAYTTTADFGNRYDEWLRDQYQVGELQTQAANQALKTQSSDVHHTQDQLVMQSMRQFVQMDLATMQMVFQRHLEGRQDQLDLAEADEKPRLKAELVQLQKLQALSRSNPAEFKKQYLALLSQQLKQKANHELANEEEHLTPDQPNKADYQERLAQYKANANPNVALAKKLRAFIALTKSVDFDAKVTRQGHRSEFVNPAYRSKPSDWKLLYRMGQEPVMAARTFAQSWLQALR